MSTKDTVKLSWEWPADRSPERTLLATVAKIEIEKGGIISNSPSMTEHLPDPMLLDAQAIGGAYPEGTHLSLRLPKMELGDTTAGDRIAIGLVDDDTCICIAKVPVDLDEKDMAAWFSKWSCSS